MATEFVPHTGVLNRPAGTSLHANPQRTLCQKRWVRKAHNQFFFACIFNYLSGSIEASSSVGGYFEVASRLRPTGDAESENMGDDPIIILCFFCRFFLGL
jgi:hypothetical protein